MNFSLEADYQSESKQEVEKIELKPGRFNNVENDLPDLEFKAFGIIEKHFWDHGQFPTEEIVLEKMQVTRKEIRTLYNNPRLIDALKRRGYDTDIMQRMDDSLTPEQLMMANMVLNPHDKLTLRQKMNFLKIKPTTYQAWLADPIYQDYLRKRAETLFKAADADAYMGLIQAVQDQDLNAIKLFFEMRGIYNPKLTVQIDVNAIMVKVVEIISKHVSNPQEILSVANELRQIGEGK